MFMLFIFDGFQDGEGELIVVCVDVIYQFEGDLWFEFVKFGVCYFECEQVNCDVGMNWQVVL